MKKETRTSKITGAFNDTSLDIDALAAVAGQMSATPIKKTAPTITTQPTIGEDKPEEKALAASVDSKPKFAASEKEKAPVVTPVQKAAKVAKAPEQKPDRRFTIAMPHALYMKMVMKTKSDGITFTKYLHGLLEKDLK